MSILKKLSMSDLAGKSALGSKISNFSLFFKSQLHQLLTVGIVVGFVTQKFHSSAQLLSFKTKGHIIAVRCCQCWVQWPEMSSMFVNRAQLPGWEEWVTKPEWPLVLRNEKFGQTDYLSALFPEGSDNFLGAQNGLVRVFSNKRNVNWDENPGRDLL